MQRNDRDYYVIVITAVFFTFFFFGSDYLELQNWLKYTLCGIGGLIAYFSAQVFKKLTTTVRIVICVLFVILFTVGVAYWSGDEEKDIQGKLVGSWITDDSDNLVIKFRITSNELFISQSPDYVEKSYGYHLNSDSLIVFKNKEIVFEWRLIMPDTEMIILSDSGETLTLSRTSN